MPGGDGEALRSLLPVLEPLVPAWGPSLSFSGKLDSPLSKQVGEGVSPILWKPFKTVCLPCITGF